MTYNGVDYAYIYNVQGDVIALVDSTGAKVVEYYYDAWGKVLSKTGTLATTLGTLNPFRYRGYVFDEETGLYYLRSRYYISEKARFINADNVNGNFVVCRVDNCFAYCNNCPTMYVDSDGNVGQIFDLGHGWHWRIDPANSNGKLQRHIHIWKDGGSKYAQNEDGSVHDGLSGTPPKWIRKELNKLKKWTWKEEPIKSVEITPAPLITPTPSPSPSPYPTPAPGPAPIVIPRQDENEADDWTQSTSNAFSVGGDTILIAGGIILFLKLALAIPTGGWSLAFP